MLAKRLKRFTSLSVREPSGVEICKKVGAIHAEQMPDPVFSQKIEYYLNIAALSEHKAVGHRYAAVYLLSKDAEEEVRIAIKTAEKIGLQPFFIIAAKDQRLIDMIQDHEYISVGEDGVSAWLYYLSNADYIITNSFHGACMAFIFGKNFSVIGRKSYPDFRVKSILPQFGAECKFIETEKDIPTAVESRLNMSLVNMRLEEMYKKTRNFVAEAINKKPQTEKITCTDLLPRDMCTGCFACGYSCPKNCITPEPEKKSGFLYPRIDKDTCINCGLCTKACPVLQNIRPEKENTSAYCGFSLNEEIRCGSSSGGFFSELALKLFEKSDTVVFGAAFETPSTVCHIEISSPEELPKLRQSKYVQSEIRNAYPKIEEHLNAGKTVLFCGTPCQCAAVKHYTELKKIDTDKLYLIDFICHSVNSPYAYSAYLKDIERQFGKTIKQISFRNKEISWEQFSICIEFNDSDERYIKWHKEDYYYYGFLKYHLYSRPCCLDCRFKGVERLTDITLADAWKVDMQTEDIKRGVSTALLHSPKGKELFDSIKDRIYCEEKTTDMVAKGNRHLCSSARPGLFSDYFYRRSAQNVPFSQIIEEIVSEKFVNNGSD